MQSESNGHFAAVTLNRDELVFVRASLGQIWFTSDNAAFQAIAAVTLEEGFAIWDALKRLKSPHAIELESQKQKDDLASVRINLTSLELGVLESCIRESIQIY